MKQLTERNAVKFVAKSIPWLAPTPSAFFVARSSMAHLALPLPVAIVTALVIEALGLTCAFMASSFADWNHTKRKTDPTAPTIAALVLGAVYLITTLGLLAGLETWPGLARYMPVVFPFLALVGTIALALIAQQEQREAMVITEKAEQRQARQLARQERKARRSDATGSDNGATAVAPGATVTPLARQARLDDIRSVNLARDGDGPMTVAQIVAKFGVSKRQAQRDISDLSHILNPSGLWAK